MQDVMIANVTDDPLVDRIPLQYCLREWEQCYGSKVQTNCDHNL